MLLKQMKRQTRPHLWMFLFQEKRRVNQNQETDVLQAPEGRSPTSSLDERWYLDSAISSHMIFERSAFITFKTLEPGKDVEGDKGVLKGIRLVSFILIRRQSQDQKDFLYAKTSKELAINKYHDRHGKEIRSLNSGCLIEKNGEIVG
ncbi:hypothetical protein O6H91_Y112700 [Diphasiastrum complanatum]|nr:hypothetical protein O6H91_Y112700 [Diphasiastrum complanatum]